MKKRVISCLVTGCLALSMMATSVWAGDAETADTKEAAMQKVATQLLFVISHWEILGAFRWRKHLNSRLKCTKGQTSKSTILIRDGDTSKNI